MVARVLYFYQSRRRAVTCWNDDLLRFLITCLANFRDLLVDVCILYMIWQILIVSKIFIWKVSDDFVHFFRLTLCSAHSRVGRGNLGTYKSLTNYLPILETLRIECRHAKKILGNKKIKHFISSSENRTQNCHVYSRTLVRPLRYNGIYLT